MTPVTVVRRSSPVVLAFPHAGIEVPEGVLARLNVHGRALADTDWHVDQLYDGIMPDATVVRAHFHRYVIDANRDPSGQSLYPGQNTTALIPHTDFDGREIWSVPPTMADTAEQIAAFHRPYHAALSAELQRTCEAHGVAILFDCHSIRSRIPFLFEGDLPDFNIGTNLGATCDKRVAQTVADICSAASGYRTVVNGRFKGGWTTRHYGRPDRNIHAIQMELAQSTYLAQEAAPWAFDPARADRLRPHLHAMLFALSTLAPSLRGSS